MRQIEIVLTSAVEGADERRPEGNYDITFVQWDGKAELPATGKDRRLFIDWILPDISGLEVCRRLRRSHANTCCHVTMVLERVDSDASRRSLQAGADDYVIGPLDLGKLLSRVLTGDWSAPSERYNFDSGEMVIDASTLEARWNGRLLALMPNERQLLRFLASHPGQAFRRNELVQAVGKDPRNIDDRTVDVWIARVRAALRGAGAGDFVQTVRQFGYVLSETARHG